MPATAAVVANIIAQANGTEQWYFLSDSDDPLNYSEGIRQIARQADAYWLIDAIKSYEVSEPAFVRKVAADEGLSSLRFWKLHVNPDHTAKLWCEYDRGIVIVEQDLEHTDFPFVNETLTLYARSHEDGKIRLCLPSEY